MLQRKMKKILIPLLFLGINAHAQEDKNYPVDSMAECRKDDYGNYRCLPYTKQNTLFKVGQNSISFKKGENLCLVDIVRETSTSDWTHFSCLANNGEKVDVTILYKYFFVEVEYPGYRIKYKLTKK